MGTCLPWLLVFAVQGEGPTGLKATGVNQETYGSPKEKVTSATVPVLHTYDPAVTFATVTLKGRYSRLAMLESGAYIADAAKLVDVAQWGTNP